MSTAVKPEAAGLVRVARHPMVRAVVKCAVMCALGAKTRQRRAVKHDNKCCP